MSNTSSNKIPNIAHFIWYGVHLPLAYVLGIKSSLLNGGFEQVILHIEKDLSAEPYIQQHIFAHPNFELRLISRAYFANTDEALQQMYFELTNPRAKSNVMRLVVLARWGGVYLDTDVIVLKEMSPLRQASFFYGNESNRYPHFTEMRSKSYLKLMNFIHGIVRYLLVKIPRGYRVHRWYERTFFYQPPNNCVIGATPHHPFLKNLFQNMLKLDAETRLKKWQLGVRLFQRTIAEASSSERNQLTAHSSRSFNPLGPMTCRLWFKKGSAHYMDYLYFKETTLIHWYSNSVKGLGSNIIDVITEETIDENYKDVAIFHFLKHVKDQKI
jgi:hypothetical protein